MKIVVGLGNPGKKYEGTRHNMGFEVLAELAHRWQAGPPRVKYQSLVSEATHAGEKVLLIAPQTFMNLSGVAVRAATDFCKLETEHLLIVCDDFNLPLGKMRFRPEGSSGGQNGLENILQHLGTPKVPRLRVGVGPVPERWEARDFVLGRFQANERELADEVVRRAADAVECWITSGIATAMNRYN